MKNKTSFGCVGSTEPGTTIIKEVKGFKFYWIFTDKGVWTTLARQVWQEAGRTIAPNMTIAHKNGNTLDCSLDNLVEVTQSAATRLHKGLPIHARAGRPRNEAKWQGKEQKAKERAERKAQKEQKERRPVGRPRKLTDEQRQEQRRAYERQYYNQKRRKPANSPELKKARQQQRIQEAQRKREERTVNAQWEKQTRDNRKREEGKRLQIKPVDTSKLIRIVIDHKTTVYARPGQDIEEIKQRYKRA